MSTPLDYAKPSHPTRDAGSAAAGTCAALSLVTAILMVTTGNLHNTLDPIIFFPWLAFSGFAVMFSVLDARRARSSGAVTAWAARGTNILLLVALVFGGVVAAGRIFGEDPHNYARGQVKCASNLKQIGLAMMLYANENGRVYPDTVDKLITFHGEYISEIFCCPQASDTPATGPTTRAVAANLMAGGHLSYVYLGNGFTDAASPAAVLGHELPGHHRGGGMNVLFGDLHVEFISEAEAQSLLSELQAGYNPPRPPKLRKLVPTSAPRKN